MKFKLRFFICSLFSLLWYAGVSRPMHYTDAIETEPLVDENKPIGAANAQLNEAAIVLFPNFLDFTTLSHNLTPTDLAKHLHEYFIVFYNLTQKYRLEKIKPMGATVNTANRMESSGEVGKVNISKATYELLKDDPQFTFENRGKIEAKGKGEVEMYFVSKSEK